MEIKISGSREPITDNDILRIEELIGHFLPSMYREFILTHNGGSPQPDSFPIMDKNWDDFGLIDCFLCVQEGDPYDLAVWIQRFINRMPSDLLPIALDPAGNLICICLAGENIGKIFFWDHENEGFENEQPWRDNIHLIADNFVEFINSFT